MVAAKEFLTDYLLKSSSNSKGHHPKASSLEVIIDKFNTFASPNCCNYVLGSKHFVLSGMGTTDSIMTIKKNHYIFKYAHGSMFPN